MQLLHDAGLCDARDYMVRRCLGDA